MVASTRSNPQLLRCTMLIVVALVSLALAVVADNNVFGWIGIGMVVLAVYLLPPSPPRN